MHEGMLQAMNGTMIRRLFCAGMLLFSLGTSGCMSPRGYQTAIDDRDAEIRRLREERAALKAQMQKNKESARVEVANASAPAAEPETAPEPAKFPELDKLGIGYGERDGNMVISIPSSITFPSGQATISKDGEKALKQVASLLKKQYGNSRYSIEGHTDTDPIKKSKFGSNRELSVQRAMAVLTYLVAECGIPDGQCIVAGHGEYDPVATNSGKDDKAKNRRVEIVVHREA